jgi:putative FmdB family regulatory protein
MPLYEYECPACGHRFEVIQKFSDEPVSSCPVCGAAPRKLLSAPAFQLKGSGWYVTDYAKKDTAKPSEAGADKGAEKKDDGKSGDSPAKSDAAPATPTPAASTSSSAKSE